VRLCELARKHGVPATSSVEWDYPPHEAIVRRAARFDADLIIAECHQGARTRPWLMHLTDWELLRTSPLPVLLLKNARPWRRPLVLAAVDPAHQHAKPSDLDNRIVNAAAEVADSLKGKLHLMHANCPNILGPSVQNASRKAATSWSIVQLRRAQTAGTAGVRSVFAPPPACRAGVPMSPTAARRSRFRAWPASCMPTSWSWGRCRAPGWSASSSATRPSASWTPCSATCWW
jgi:hypothetical protein